MADARLLVCPALVDDVRAVVPDDAADQVDVQGFDAAVAAGNRDERPLLDLGEDLTVPSTCHAVERTGCLRCAQSLLPRGALAYLGPEALVITPGWLREWAGSGWPAVRPDLGTPPSRVVLLDTGRDAAASDALAHFSRVIGLPASILPVGTDHLRLRVELAIARWQRDRAVEGMRRARHSTTAHALALEILGQLATLTSEDRVIQGLTELFTLLFSPGVLRYTPAAPPALLPELGQDATDDTGYATWTVSQPWVETGTGFAIRVEHDGRLIGVFELAEFATPETRPDDITLALTVARAAGMAIANARAMHGVVPICAYCKKIRDEAGEWWAIESYLSDHTDARFSHGICPGCLRRELEAVGINPQHGQSR